jgi:hypothetical protein
MFAELKCNIMKRILTLSLGLCSTIFSIYAQINIGSYFLEDFENSTRFSQWEITVLSGSSEWEQQMGLPYGDVENAGSGNFNASYSSYNYNGDRSMLSSPRIDLSSSINPVLRFSYVQPAWSIDQDSLKVYYKSANDSEWILLSSYGENVEDWTTVSIALPDASFDYYIAFEAISGYGYGTGIDNVLIEEGEPCGLVSGFEANNVKETSVSLRWNESLCNSFEIEYGNTGFEHGDGNRLTGIKGNSAIVDGLVADTSYDFFIRAYCSEGISEWSEAITITTACGIGAILPYIESFENTNNHFECWEIVYANADYHPGNKVIAFGSGAYDGDYLLRFSSFEAGAPYNQYLISPVINVDEFTEFSFMYKAVEGSSEVFQIGFSTNELISEVSVQWTDFVTNANGEWKQYSTAIPEGTKRVYLHYGTQFGYYLYVDRIRIGHPADCEIAENIIVEDLGIDYATLSWDENESIFAVEYGVEGFEKGTGTKIYTSGESQITIENLIAFTQYSFYGLTDCEGSTLYSDAVGFTTFDKCAQISSIALQNVGLSFAQLAWDTNNQQAVYNFEYGLSGFTKGTGIVLTELGSPEIYIESLLTDTEYDVYVQAICPQWNSASLWSEVFSFRTDEKDDNISSEVPEDIMLDDQFQSALVVSISSANPVIYICADDSEIHHVDLIIKNEGSVVVEAGTAIDYIIEDLTTGFMISETIVLNNGLNPGEAHLFSTIHGFSFSYELNPISISLYANDLIFKIKKVELSFVRLFTDFTFDGASNNVIDAESFPFELSATVSSNTDNYSIINDYFWSTGDYDDKTVVEQSGDYTFTVSNEFCSVTKNITVKSIDSDEESEEFQIYPNPTHGVITITNILPSSPVSFVVFDAAGRLVYSQTVNGPEQTIDLTLLSAGIYSAFFTQDGNSEMHRLLIE